MVGDALALHHDARGVLKSSDELGEALQSILSDWNGTIFATLDARGSCRAYAYVLHMLQANEIWKQSARMLEIAAQIDAQLWKLQNSDGSIRFDLSSQSTGGEEAGMTLVSHHARVPSWFGH